MKTTKDYSQFKLLSENRKIHEDHVRKIMKSISARNLLHHEPILVNSQMEVLDGQHRLEAAKRLDLPIYYNVSEDCRDDDIIILNQTKKLWKMEDYLNYFVSKGNPDYIRLKGFMDKTDCTLSVAYICLGYKIKDTKAFRKGDFKFPSLEEEVEAAQIIEKTEKLVSYLSTRTVDMNKYLNGPRFKRTSYIFFSCKSVDFETFMQKLSYRLELLRPASRIRDLLVIFEQIYNWKNKNPVSLNELF